MEKIKSLIAETSFPSGESFISSRIEYNTDGKPIFSETRNEEGFLESMSKMEYDSEGRLIAHQEFMDEEEVSEENLYHYEGNHLIRTESKYADGSATIRSYFRKDEGRVVEIQSEDEEGSFEGREISWYLDEGQLQRREIYNEDNLLITIVENQFDEGGRIIRQTESDGQGRLKSESRLSYDEMGNLIQQISLTGQGKVSARMVQAFDEKGRVVEQVVGSYHLTHTEYNDEQRNRREERWIQGQLESVTEQFFDERDLLTLEKMPGREIRYSYSFHES